MTEYFEMDRFISAVVTEEEQKHKIEESYGDAVEENQLDEEEEEEISSVNLVGTSRTQQVKNIERLKRRQRKASRRKYLESVTPRLEILQNMPFFIPFATRVQIFRQFVMLDQMRRRGVVDADEWRFRMMNSGPSGGDMSRHRAKVRRENVFDDAYEQFFQLGEGLKEPIQIKFVDKFDTVEEGIDGGGVTKEFLTSVTSEAFSPNNGLNLFVENDQHLLYPNPSAIEEREDLLQQAGIKRGSMEWNQSIRDLLQRYEFLGRIIGKCLYEGILVDIHFAGFFLLKWALTGGTGSAAKESGYRANINDLRDLDESLFQGLVSTNRPPSKPASPPTNIPNAPTKKLPRQCRIFLPRLHCHRHPFQHQPLQNHHPQPPPQRRPNPRHERKPPHLHPRPCAAPPPNPALEANQRIPKRARENHLAVLARHVQPPRTSDPRRRRQLRDRRRRSPQ